MMLDRHHQPMRLITVEAPMEYARKAIESAIAEKRLVHNGWIRLLVVGPEPALSQQEWFNRSARTGTRCHDERP